MKSLVASAFSIFCFSVLCPAQNDYPDLLKITDSLAQGEKPNAQFVSATFKSTHLINSQTVEVPGKHSLDVRISHHFGDLNTGAYNAWGIDGPTVIRLGMDYSYDGRLSVGIGRSSYEKMADASLKYKLLRQQKAYMPLTLTLVSTMYYNATQVPDMNGYNEYHYLSDRFSYCHQMIFGRKFSDRLSFQFALVYVHFNTVEAISDKNDIWALQAGGRFKLNKRFAITAEASYVLNHYSELIYYSPISLGFEIETGGHVFQIFLSNADGLVENQYIPYTQSSWKSLGLKIGFNISRAFAL